MFESRKYRDTLAETLTTAERDVAKEILDKEKGTPEYEISAAIKSADTAYQARNKAQEKAIKAEAALRKVLSPSYAYQIENRISYGEDSLARVNFQFFSSLMQAVIDDSFKEKMRAIYSELNEAEKDATEKGNAYDEKQKLANKMVKEAGGADVVQEMLGEKNELFSTYIKQAQELKQTESQIIGADAETKKDGASF